MIAGTRGRRAHDSFDDDIARYGSTITAVMLGVMAARLDVMMFGVAGMPVRGMGMVRRLLVIAGFMVLRGFAVMLGCVLVMLGGLVMMLDARMRRSCFSPGSVAKSLHGLTQFRLTLC